MRLSIGDCKSRLIEVIIVLINYGKKRDVRSFLTRALHSIVESAIRNISGGLGQRIRYFYYKLRFRSCGKNVRIDEGVIIQNPESIEIGNDVWILPYTILTGRGSVPIGHNRRIRYRGGISGSKSCENVLLKIGDQTSIGAYNIIHGYGGLTMGNKVTTSAKVAIYSFSHAPNDPSCPETVTYANSMVKDAPIACIVSPIVLEDGVWVGLGAAIFAGRIGKNTFISSHSIVVGDLEENGYASGNPAKIVKKRFL